MQHSPAVASPYPVQEQTSVPPIEVRLVDQFNQVIDAFSSNDPQTTAERVMTFMSFVVDANTRVTLQRGTMACIICLASAASYQTSWTDREAAARVEANNTHAHIPGVVTYSAAQLPHYVLQIASMLASIGKPILEGTEWRRRWEASQQAMRAEQRARIAGVQVMQTYPTHSVVDMMQQAHHGQVAATGYA